MIRLPEFTYQLIGRRQGRDIAGYYLELVLVLLDFHLIAQKLSLIHI